MGAAPERANLRPVRIALLGPIEQYVDAVETVGRFCLEELETERVIYLGRDAKLDQAVKHWAVRLVGHRPEDSAIWRRSLACQAASPAEIDDFVARERRRQWLSRLHSLPSEGVHLQIMGTRRVLFCHDDKELEPVDVQTADVVAVGNRAEPAVIRVEERFFLSPGTLSTGGLMLLDATQGLELQLFNRHCELLSTHQLFTPLTTQRIGAKAD